jgi:Uma2 family endonuclease
VDTPWEAWPIPLLVVEAMSRITRRRDFGDKRDLYGDAHVSDYWIIDDENECIHMASGEEPAVTVSDALRWHPDSASAPLTFAIDILFR